MTHDELIEVGKQWLAESSCTGERHGGCSIILSEMTSAGRETPDVIGWHCGFSTLIECKAGRSDFIADKRKFFRKNPEMGVGDYRYYMAPEGLIDISDLPRKWGLIIVRPTGKTRVLRASSQFSEINKRAEIDLLLSLIRRLKVEPGKHVMIKAYTIESEKDPRATVGLSCEEDEANE